MQWAKQKARANGDHCYATAAVVKIMSSDCVPAHMGQETNRVDQHVRTVMEKGMESWRAPVLEEANTTRRQQRVKARKAKAKASREMEEKAVAKVSTFMAKDLECHQCNKNGAPQSGMNSNTVSHRHQYILRNRPGPLDIVPCRG